MLMERPTSQSTMMASSLAPGADGNCETGCLYSGGHVVFCNGAFGVKSLTNASRRKARSSVRGRRDAATSCDQTDRASQSRVHVVQTAVRPTPTCAALLDPASLRRDLVIKELLALRYSSWPDWD